MPIRSPVGKWLFSRRVKPSNTQGRYGAVKTNRPRKLSGIEGLRRDQMYTNVNARGDPRNGIDTNGERH